MCDTGLIGNYQSNNDANKDFCAHTFCEIRIGCQKVNPNHSSFLRYFFEDSSKKLALLDIDTGFLRNHRANYSVLP